MTTAGRFLWTEFSTTAPRTRESFREVRIRAYLQIGDALAIEPLEAVETEMIILLPAPYKDGQT